MPSTTVHDIIALGTDPGTLMAAGMLRRMSYRVMLAGQGAPRDSYEDEGERIPAIFHSLPPRGFSQVLDKAFDELNLEDKVHQLGADHDHHVQVITPDTRLDIFLERQELAEELKRAVPEQEKAFLRGLDTVSHLNGIMEELIQQGPAIPPYNVMERITAKSLHKRLEEKTKGLTWDSLVNDQPPMMRIILEASTFLSNMDPVPRSPAATARLAMAFFKGIRLVPDLVPRMQDAIENAGVEMSPSMMAEKLLIYGRMVKGFQALRSASDHSCQAMITGGPLTEIAEMVPSAMRRLRAKFAADTSRAKRSLFTLNLIIPKDAVPLGMANHVLLVRKPGDRLEEENLIRIMLLPYQHRQDRVQLNLSCMVPFKKRSLGREYLAPLQIKLLQAVQWLVPFMEKFDLRNSSPFWSSRASDPGHPAPWSIHNTFELLDEALLGIAKQTMRTPLKNLLLCGPTVFPALGLEGQALAANRVVDWVEKNHKLKKVLTS